MAKLPLPPPPAALARLGPEILAVPSGTSLWRIYFRGGPHPATWDQFRSYGPIPSSRFDHHLPPPSEQGRAILYAAAHGPTCVAEVFQETRTIERSARDPWLVEFVCARELRLLDLRGAWSTRAGASAAIHSGRRDHARLWARAAHEAFPSIDGLAYCSSMDGNRTAFALFERARSSMPRQPLFHRALRDPSVLPALLNAARSLGYVVY